jgi:nucleoside-diphosphate-sugar epimerase
MAGTPFELKGKTVFVAGHRGMVGAALVRRLAQEAIEKIDGELPSQHSTQIAAQKAKLVQPADEKLAKLREFDKKMQEMER